MPRPPRPRQAHPASPAEFVAFLVAYVELLVAHWQPGDRLISRQQFHAWSVDDGILLWMLYHDHVEHLKAGLDHAAPTPAGSLILTDESCFALKERGAAFAEAFLADVLCPQLEGAFDAAWDRLLVGLLLPAFDQENRLFAWGEHLLKRFRQPSVNQELVLRAAEELSWPEWFDDPLPRRNGRNPKMLLHDTIKDLNRRQVEQLVQFKGDGSGRRVGWGLR